MTAKANVIYKEQIKISKETFTLQLSLSFDLLEARLINQSDPFFLYFYSLHQTEYQALKASQNLVVSFAEFPQKLIELIECYRCESSSASFPFSSASRYSVKLEAKQEAYTLSIVEVNSFRSVEIVKLLFQKAGEVELKAHLHALISQLTGERDSLQEQLEKASCSLSSCLDNERALEKKIHQKRSELEALQAELDHCRIKLSQASSHAEALAKENASLQEQMENLRRETEKLRQTSLAASQAEASKSKDIAKANEIIAKFQQEHSKLKNSLKTLESAEERREEKEICLSQRVEEMKRLLVEKENKLVGMQEIQLQLERALKQNKHMEMEIKAQNELLEHLHRENKPSGLLVEPSKKLPPIPVFEERSFDAGKWSFDASGVVPETPKFFFPTSRHV